MVKLVALYKKPEDEAAFMQHYNGVHTPLVKKIPGLRKLEITHLSGSPMGEAPWFLMAEMYYDSMDAMNSANASPEGKATARDLMSFAIKHVTMVFGEVKETESTK